MFLCSIQESINSVFQHGQMLILQIFSVGTFAQLIITRDERGGRRKVGGLSRDTDFLRSSNKSPVSFFFPRPSLGRVCTFAFRRALARRIAQLAATFRLYPAHVDSRIIVDSLLNRFYLLRERSLLSRVDLLLPVTVSKRFSVPAIPPSPLRRFAPLGPLPTPILILFE